MVEILFDIPTEAHPEPGVPEKIEHRCDYMILPDGVLDYHYNFFVYTWRISDELISARSYLDLPDEVSVFVACARLQADPALEPLVHYLQRRYRLIQGLDADDTGDTGTGYCVAFRKNCNSGQ